MARIKEVSNEVLIAQDPIVEVNNLQLDDLKARAARSPRFRARLCAHKDSQNRLHEMLIVLTKNVYIRPHKHINKTESFHVIEGAATVIFFDESGKIDEVLHIGDHQSGKPFYFRNEDARYHTQIITSDFLVFHEITNGPFNREDTVFAPWAPEEGDLAGTQTFMDKMRRDVAAYKRPAEAQ